MADPRIPTCPGEILQDELATRGLSANRLAKDLGLDPVMIVEILCGRKSITADTAIRLAQYLGLPAEVWLNTRLNNDLTRLDGEKDAPVINQVRRSG